MSARTEATKKRLYKATLELAGSKGVEGTSIDEIAERAGLVKATVYYHFPSKNDLIRASLQHKAMELTGRFEGVCTEHEGSPLHCTSELASALVDYLSNDRAFSMFMTRELWREGRHWHDVLADLRHTLVETICSVVKSGVDAGEIRDDIDPDFAGYSIFGMALFSALDHLVYEPEQPYEALLIQMKEAVELVLTRR